MHTEYRKSSEKNVYGMYVMESRIFEPYHEAHRMCAGITYFEPYREARRMGVELRKTHVCMESRTFKPFQVAHRTCAGSRILEPYHEAHRMCAAIKHRSMEYKHFWAVS